MPWVPSAIWSRPGDSRYRVPTRPQRPGHRPV